MWLEQVVPWGRSLDEYVWMFGLSEQDLAGRILGVGDGPASFNADMHRRGRRVTSCDPIYTLGPDQIRARIEATFETVLEQTRQHRANYIWDAIASVEELGRVRMAAMARFLADYPSGGRQGRYVASTLPNLPFANGAFDLALCSHLLFLYTEQLGRDFHVQSVLEMGRAAREVRVFPLLDLQCRPSAHVGPVVRACEAAGRRVVIEEVPYEFQRGADRMMRILPRS
jgi:SAM-dependent methyltransferase